MDEFAEAEQVAGALAEPGAAATLLAVQHPHRTPDAIASGLALPDTLPAARAALGELLGSTYREVTDVLAPYRVTGPDGTALGVLCVVDPDSVAATGARQVRQGEQVYPEVVADRATVLSGLRVATSAAMLVPISTGDSLTGALERACTELGPPELSTVDSAGRRRELWLLGQGALADGVLAAARGGPLLVADGNHRVAAARYAGLGGLLALVTAGPALRVGPIHRALVGVALSADELATVWRGLGLDVVDGTPAVQPEHPGWVTAVVGEHALRVRLPEPEPGEPLPRIDHDVVERFLVGEALGVDQDSAALRPFNRYGYSRCPLWRSAGGVVPAESGPLRAASHLGR
ncbi:MAG: DUF1015 family protein [Sciscionella sp.]